MITSHEPVDTPGQDSNDQPMQEVNYYTEEEDADYLKPQKRVRVDEMSSYTMDNDLVDAHSNQVKNPGKQHGGGQQSHPKKGESQSKKYFAGSFDSGEEWEKESNDTNMQVESVSSNNNTSYQQAQPPFNQN